MPRSLSRSLLVALVACFVAPAALAQDDDDFQFDDLEDDAPTAPSTPPPTRIDEDDDLDADDDGSEDLLDDPTAPSEDLLGEEENTNADDTAVLYRRMLERVAEASPEEEIELWEAYLARYPNSAFKERIEERIEALLTSLYEDGEQGPQVDAQDQEIMFSQGLLLDNIDPRTRIQAGFEWGLPNFGNLYAAYEHQLQRELSVHGGLRRRYTGWSVEAGGRYALVKSLRSKMLVTAMGDLQFNLNPAYLSARPHLAIGKRFGPIDAQIQAGPALELTGPVGVRMIGGANVTYKAADTVALFFEGTVNLKNLTWREGKTFVFDVATFGMKFMPENRNGSIMEVNVGANVPFARRYWMYHFGSIMAQINYYPKPRD